MTQTGNFLPGRLWPAGFIYSCCGKNFKAKRCHMDKHRAGKELAEDDIEDYNEEGDKIEYWTEDEEDAEADNEEDFTGGDFPNGYR